MVLENRVPSSLKQMELRQKLKKLGLEVYFLRNTFQVAIYK